jgi:uncharacterized protein
MDGTTPLVNNEESDRERETSKAFSPSYLILILTRRCNLSCKYCYNGPAEGMDMSGEVMDAAFRLLSGGTGPFHVQLTGGEPTLVPELIFMALERARDLSERTGRPGTAALQTNGTLLTKDLIRELKSLKVEFGISLDGSPDVNERVRGGSAELLQGLRLLTENSVYFNVTAVVTRFNLASLYELPLFLSPYPGVRGLGLDLLVRKGRGEGYSPERSLLAEAAKRLSGTLTLVNSRRKPPLILRERELVKRACVKGSSPRFCEAHRSMSLASDTIGRHFPCGQAAGDDSLSMGTVFAPKPPRINFGDYTLSGPHCEGCVLRGRCPGECPSRLYFNPGDDPPLVCELYRGLYEPPGRG